jgi:hypothetical protein
MTLSADQLLRQFLLHVLPKGFVRIRFFGFLAHRRRATLLPFAGNCRRLSRLRILRARLYHRHCPRGLAPSAVAP